MPVVEVTSQLINDVLVVRLIGRLDIIGSEGLERKLVELLKNSTGNILLNRKDVSYMSSSGISAVLGASRVASTMKRKLALCEISPSIQKLLEVVELGNIFPVYETQGDGIEKLR